MNSQVNNVNEFIKVGNNIVTFTWYTKYKGHIVEKENALFKYCYYNYISS